MKAGAYILAEFHIVFHKVKKNFLICFYDFNKDKGIKLKKSIIRCNLPEIYHKLEVALDP